MSHGRNSSDSKTKMPQYGGGGGGGGGGGEGEVGGRFEACRRFFAFKF